jgi:hypothetical protein
VICFDGRVLDTVRRLLAALVLAGCGVLALGAPSQAACPAVTGTTQSHTKDASDVFSGTVKDRAREGDQVVYEVEVERVYKGEIGTAQVKVSTPAASNDCGLPDLRSNRRYVFFARADGSALATDQASGTASASARLVKKVERLLGDGRVAVAPEPEKAEFTRVADAQPDSLTRLAAPGVALVLVGLLGLLVVRRLARA